jgi:exopolysaccharide biosynthesis polyprenyl glycosylphosphotransferase
VEGIQTIDIQSKIKYVETVSKRKLKKNRILNLLNGILILLEIASLLGLFYSIFSWYINGPLTPRYQLLVCFILMVYIVQGLNKGLFRFVSPYNWVNELFQIVKIAFITFMVMSGTLFLLKVSYDFSRVVIGVFFVGLVLCSWTVRLIKRAILYILSENHIFTKNILIVGAGKIGVNLHAQLITKNDGSQFIGFLDDYKQDKNIVGTLSDIDKVIDQYDVDEVIVTIPSERKFIYNLIKNIQKYKVNVKIIPDLYGLVSTKVGVDQVDPYPFVEFGSNRITGWNGFIKRIVDITASLIGIVILIPVFILLWIAVKVSSPGPAIFKQKRIGKDGKPFHIYKFRTMVVDAEKRLKEDPELYRKYLENNYKLEPKDDPRITNFGRFLRKTSLDELPQLFNVLKGDMSLVGPRPVVYDELKEYDQLVFDFLSVKPGITGYWQVNGRSETGYPERVDIELYYVYHQSLSLDLKIILKTFLTVLKRNGAY